MSVWVCDKTRLFDVITGKLRVDPALPVGISQRRWVVHVSLMHTTYTQMAGGMNRSKNRQNRAWTSE